MSGRGVDSEAPADGWQTVGHIGQPGADGRRVESAAGVADREGKHPVRDMGGDRHRGVRAAVFGGILQRFAAAEIEGGLDRDGVAAQALQVGFDGDRGARGDRRQGFGQTAADEQRGVNSQGEAADLGDRVVQQPGGLDE